MRPHARRRAEAPPPPRPTDPDDPLALTLKEWRDAERLKVATRRRRTRFLAAAVVLPLLAGGLYAFPAVYVWRGVCRRWSPLRPWGALALLPAALACWLLPGPVFGPTASLLRLPFEAGPALPVVAVLPVPGYDVVRGLVQGALPFLPLPDEAGVGVTNAAPVLAAALTAGWPTALVLAGVLAGAWGVGWLLEGARLRALSPQEVWERGRRARAASGDRWKILPGLVLRGFVSMIYAPEGGGKSEWFFAFVAACRRGRDFCGLPTRPARFYLLSEQTHTTLEVYLERWGLNDRGAQRWLRIVTPTEAEALWKKHGHEEQPDWPHFGPIVMADAAAWRADVFVMDTTTNWIGGGASADALDVAFGKIKTAIAEWGMGFLMFSHTNAEGDLLGNKELRRLADVAWRMVIPRGKDDPLRGFLYDKDRSGTRLASFFGCVREVEPDPPHRGIGFRAAAVTQQELEDARPGKPARGGPRRGPSAPPQRPGSSVLRLLPGGGGVGGVPGEGTPRTHARTAQNGPGGGGDPHVEAVRLAVQAGAETVPAVVKRTGLDRFKVNRAFTKLEAAGEAERTSKAGQAVVWRLKGDDDAGRTVGTAGVDAAAAAATG